MANTTQTVSVSEEETSLRRLTLRAGPGRAFRIAAPLLPYLPALAMGIYLLARAFLAPHVLDGNTDESLLAGSLILQGKIPFHDFWEVNPPLVFYLHVPPVWLAQLFGTTPELVFLVMVLALVSLGAARIATVRMDPVSRAAVLFAYLSCSWIAAALNGLGEREHLFAIAFFPYLVQRAHWPPRSRALLAWAFATALLALLKPAFLLLLCAAELLLFLRGVPATWPLLLALISPFSIYIAMFLRMPLPSLRAYFTQQIPEVLRYFPSHDNTWSELYYLWRHYLYFAPLVYLLLAGGFWRARVAPSLLLRAFALLGGLSFFLVIYSRRTYGYHMLIFDGFLCGGSVLALRELLVSPRMPRWQAFTTAGVVLGLLGALYGGYFSVRGAGWGFHEPIDALEAKWEPLFAGSKPGERAVVFSSNPDIAWPMIYRHQLLPGTRYLIMYPLGFFNMDGERKRELAKDPIRLSHVEPEEAAFIANVRQDLERNKPELLIFPRTNSLTARLQLDSLRYAWGVGWFEVIGANYHSVMNNSDYVVLRRNQP